MSDPARPMLGADDFIAWAMDRPAEARWELAHGGLVAMERGAHARAKLRLAERLSEAVCKAGLACEVFVAGMAVQADETTAHEPDALVRCGPPSLDGAVKITDPVIVVEVVSRSSRARDTGAKLADYMRIASFATISWSARKAKRSSITRAAPTARSSRESSVTTT